MNLLAHLWLAERTDTSAAGQILGDIVKGRIDAPRFDARTDEGIRLHRAIDSTSDAHPAHRELRERFRSPLRRYAGIIVDIGFDHALARRWPDYSAEPFAVFARRIAARVAAEWPNDAPAGPPDVQGFAGMLSGYADARGIERALTAVGRRATRRNPLAAALPALLAEYPGFVERLPRLLTRLEAEMLSRTRA
ncbi:ACP phosphodiesterase [Salinisphaera sp.]|uniref:ACP phosphodiesterase n=1 Tax=Salinisphaera sp. TaxID=1914330 RepID=UPI002D77200B|nr:ACP phosphodiesterase [Salinisphaera sp.]HET7314600.1 ACP phosphodiesterase [Salinisphaera sp.]